MMLFMMNCVHSDDYAAAVYANQSLIEYIERKEADAFCICTFHMIRIEFVPRPLLLLLLLRRSKCV